MRDLPACGPCQAERTAGGTDPEKMLRSTFAVGNAEVCDVCALLCAAQVAMPRIDMLTARLDVARKLLGLVLSGTRVDDEIKAFLSL